MNNKIADMEKQKLNDSIESKYPTPYTNNAYGKLSELYNTFNSLNYNSLSDAAKTSMSNNIDDCINDIIAYIENTRIRPENFELIKYRIKSIYATKLGIDIFTDAERKRIELLKSFDFELEKPNENQLILITNAYDKILAAIGEVNTKYESVNKLQNTKSLQTAKKDLLDFIRMEWDLESKHEFKKLLKEEFKNIKEDFEDLEKQDKQSLNLIALALVDLEILKSKIQDKTLFEATANLFLVENPEKSQENFNKLKRKEYINYSKIDKYKTTVEKIEKIVRHINLYNPKFKVL